MPGGISRNQNRIYDNGKECIQLYKDFLKKRDHVIANEVLGHNLEDVLGLGRIFEMLVTFAFMIQNMKLHMGNSTAKT